MEVRENDRPEKAYCCSNLPQTEAAIIAKFDLVLQGISLLIGIIFIAVVASSSESNIQPPQNAQTQKSQTTPSPIVTNDPSLFFDWPRDSKLLALSLDIVNNVVQIGFTIVLLIGVKKRKHAYLLTWFIFTIVRTLLGIISGVVLIAMASDKVFMSILTVVTFLYKWYCLWIVKLLMSEVRAVREGYANPLDDGEIDHASNLMPSSDSFTVNKF